VVDVNVGSIEVGFSLTLGLIQSAPFHFLNNCVYQGFFVRLLDAIKSSSTAVSNKEGASGGASEVFRGTLNNSDGYSILRSVGIGRLSKQVEGMFKVNNIIFVSSK
jgi:hypothetical protein